MTEFCHLLQLLNSFSNSDEIWYGWPMLTYILWEMCSGAGLCTLLQLRHFLLTRQFMTRCRRIYILHARFDVFTAVTMKNVVFWDMATLCRACKSWRFGRTYHLHLQGEELFESPLFAAPVVRYILAANQGDSQPVTLKIEICYYERSVIKNPHGAIIPQKTTFSIYHLYLLLTLHPPTPWSNVIAFSMQRDLSLRSTSF
jgi:hypothetical protein